MKKTIRISLVTLALFAFLFSLSLFGGSFVMHKAITETLGIDLTYAQSVNGFLTKNAEGEREKQVKEGSLREDHKHISIYYQESFSNVLPLTKETLDLAIEKSERLLGETPAVPFDLLVFEDLTDLNDFAALKDAGGFYSDFHKVMGISNWGEEEILTEDTYAFYRFRNVLVHEYAHYAFERKVSSQAPYPIWFIEGLAEYTAANPEDVFFPHFKVISFHSLTDYKQWDKALAMHTANPYLQSYCAINFLTEEYGEKVIKQLIESVDKTGNFEESLLAITGLTVSQLEKSFLRDYQLGGG